MIDTILKEYGLNDKERQVYLTLIKLGASPVRSIASESGVNRGTTYDILKSLITQGLVSYYDKDAHQYFVVEFPEKLVTALEGRQDDIKNLKLKLNKIMPELQTFFGHQGGKPISKLYEGKKGVRVILEEVLQMVSDLDDKTYYVYSSSSLRKNIYQSMPDFSDKRKKKNIKVKTIALGEGGRLVGLDERKWIKTKQKLQNAVYEIIYAGKVAFISLDDSENPVGVVIENDGIYSTQKMIFESNWEHL